MLDNPRFYGNPPYKIAVVHGGPGGAGYMAPVAKEISKEFGVIEPLQTELSVYRQAGELYKLVKKHCERPVILAGHSWGAWLSLMLAAEHPSTVKKLIMVSSGALEEGLNNDLMLIRQARLSDNENIDLSRLLKELAHNSGNNNKESFRRFANLVTRADSYELIPESESLTMYRPDIHRKVWAEAAEMRSAGRLAGFIRKLECPVAVIHGKYDPHPYQGVKIPLERHLKDFSFHLLDKCGHYPWREKFAREDFYKILLNLCRD